MLLEMTNIKKIYNENKTNAVHALRGIDFHVEQGSMVSIMGASGSGKTTLLNIIGCLDHQFHGNYLLDGLQIDSLSENQKAAIRNEKIGFVLQDFGLIEGRTVMENVSVPLYFSKTKYTECQPRAIEILEQLKIADLYKRPVSELSGGQKQRIAIARALVMHPDVILADEPTGALDSSTAHDMAEVLTALNKSGVTIIIVTHNPNLAQICKRQYLITDGFISTIK